MKKNLESIIAAIIGIVVIISAGFLYQQNNNRPWTLDRFKSQKLHWQNCADGSQCSTFKVPIDYSNLDGGNFTLQVLRHLATSKNKLGSLFVNPGGPGGSALDYAAGATEIVSKSIYSQYDIVGFDERGVGSSEPIRCLSDKEEDDFINQDSKANTYAELVKMEKTTKFFASSCLAVAGKKLGHVSTFEAAKDMDILRSALGEAKLNYLGKSYGTYLGAIYISLFPNNVGKFVLDGAVDPNISLRDQNLNQAVGFEKALDDYLSVNKEFTKREIQKFIENSGNNPIKDKRGRELTRSLLVTAVAASLYDNTLGWQTLKTGLHQAIKMGNPKYLFELADSYNNRDTNGHYYSNENDIGIVVNCLDWSDRPTAKELFDDAPNFSKVSPTFGPYIAYSELACVNWPVPPLQAKLPFKNISSPPFVIVGVTKDPATPYLWAQNLNREFPNSVLLTFDGEGHTGHNRGNSCIDNNVDSFFLRGALPKIGLICGKVGN